MSALEISTRSNGLHFSRRRQTRRPQQAELPLLNYSSLISPSIVRVPRSIKSVKSTISFKSVSSASSGSRVRSGPIRILITEHSQTPFVWPKPRQLKLLDLPSEVLELVVSQVDPTTMLNVTLTCKQLHPMAMRALCETVALWSTYRFAQFTMAAAASSPAPLPTAAAATARGNIQIASLVRHLDLSGIENRVEPQFGIAYAGWRDWKLRTEPLYYTSTTRQMRHLRGQFKGRGRSRLYPAPGSLSSDSMTTIVRVDASTDPINDHPRHPLQSPLLRKFSATCDLPTGAVLKAIKLCRNLRTLDLACLSLAGDYYIVDSLAAERPQFVSDVVRTHTWKDHEVRMVSSTDIVDAIIGLEHLQELRLQMATWISKRQVAKLLDESASVKNGCLELVDLSGAGMIRNAPWAICGTPQQVRVQVDN